MKLFNEEGWRIPNKKYRTFNDYKTRYYKLNPSVNSNQKCFELLLNAYPSLKSISLAQFENAIHELTEKITNDNTYSPLLKSRSYPFLIQKNPKEIDLGEQLEEELLPLVENSYLSQFPNLHFKSVIQNNKPLSGMISIKEKTRYEQLVECNRESIIFGLYFPEVLSGYDIPSQINQMDDLPPFEMMCLSGSLDICSAVIGNPQILFHEETYSPILCMTALEHQDERLTCLFKSYGPHLEFWGLGNQLLPGIPQVSEQWTGGLTFYQKMIT
tara:strand:+ start:217 stop:1029 length:813 start_codon:yes stop_codon:yes gene_type:complete